MVRNLPPVSAQASSARTRAPRLVGTVCHETNVADQQGSRAAERLRVRYCRDGELGTFGGWVRFHLRA